MPGEQRSSGGFSADVGAPSQQTSRSLSPSSSPWLQQSLCCLPAAGAVVSADKRAVGRGSPRLPLQPSEALGGLRPKGWLGGHQRLRGRGLHEKQSRSALSCKERGAERDAQDAFCAPGTCARNVCGHSPAQFSQPPGKVSIILSNVETEGQLVGETVGLES